MFQTSVSPPRLSRWQANFFIPLWSEGENCICTNCMMCWRWLVGFAMSSMGALFWCGYMVAVLYEDIHSGHYEAILAGWFHVVFLESPSVDHGKWMWLCLACDYTRFFFLQNVQRVFEWLLVDRYTSSDMGPKLVQHTPNGGKPVHNLYALWLFLDTYSSCGIGIRGVCLLWLWNGQCVWSTLCHL